MDNMISAEVAGRIVLESIEGINGRFVRDGQEEWDRCGEGSFARFIQFYVRWRWYEMVRLN